MRLVLRILKVLFYLALTLVVLFVLGTAVPVALQAVFLLCFGWLVFLLENLGQAQVNPAMFAAAGISLVLVYALGHSFLGWLYAGNGSGEDTDGEETETGAETEAPGWHHRWTAAGLGVILMLFVAGIGTIGLVHQTIWFALTDPVVVGGMQISSLTRAVSHYEEAVRLARSTYVKSNTQVALGLTSTAPSDTSGWISIFDRGRNPAPGGGPAYAASSDDRLGRVGVVSTSAAGVTITRPAFDGLTAETTIVVAEEER